MSHASMQLMKACHPGTLPSGMTLLQPVAERVACYARDAIRSCNAPTEKFAGWMTGSTDVSSLPSKVLHSAKRQHAPLDIHTANHRH